MKYALSVRVALLVEILLDFHLRTIMENIEEDLRKNKIGELYGLCKYKIYR